MVQNFPTEIPGRKYISGPVADAMKLPFSVRDANRKFDVLLQKCKDNWALEDAVHLEQMELCRELMELAAHMLPGRFVTSETCKDFVFKCLEKDFLMCLKNIRKGI